MENFFNSTQFIYSSYQFITKLFLNESENEMDTTNEVQTKDQHKVDHQIYITHIQDITLKNYCLIKSKCFLKFKAKSKPIESLAKKCFREVIKILEEDCDTNEYFLFKSNNFVIRSQYNSLQGTLKSDIQRISNIGEEETKNETELLIETKIQTSMYDNHDPLIELIKEYCKNLVLLSSTIFRLDYCIEIFYKPQEKYYDLILDVSNQIDTNKDDLVICFCQNKRDKNTKDITCKECFNIFHYHCLNIEPNEIFEEENFVCPICYNKGFGRKRKRIDYNSQQKYILKLNYDYNINQMIDLIVKKEKSKYSIFVFPSLDIFHRLEEKREEENENDGVAVRIRFVTELLGIIRDEEELKDICNEFKINDFSMSNESTIKWRSEIGIDDGEIRISEENGALNFDFYSTEKIGGCLKSLLIYIVVKEKNIVFRYIHKRIKKMCKKIIRRKKKANEKEEELLRNIEKKREKEMFIDVIGESIQQIINFTKNQEFQKKCFEILEVNEFDNIKEKVIDHVKKIV